MRKRGTNGRYTRKYTFSFEVLEKVTELMDAGLSVREIAQKLGVGRATVGNWRRYAVLRRQAAEAGEARYWTREAREVGVE